MSFDLFVLFKEINSNTQAIWVEKLKEVGIDAQFPSDNIFALTGVGGVNIRCKSMPSLAKDVIKDQDYQLNLCISFIEPEVMDDYLECADDDLKTELSKMKSELLLSSNSGRTSNDLILQCYLAATLADVTDGLLFDPQEFGLVDSKAVYEVAKYHKKNISPKQSNNAIKSETENIVSDFIIKKKKESNKSRTIFLLSLLIVVLLKMINR